MIATMSFSRLIAAGALLALGAVLVSVPACLASTPFENGQQCLRDEECASKQCTANRCIGQNGGVPPLVDSGAPKTDTAVGDASDAPGDSSDGGGEAGSDATDASEVSGDTESEAATDTADGATPG
jgi:hypothetical protein